MKSYLYGVCATLAGAQETKRRKIFIPKADERVEICLNCTARDCKGTCEKMRKSAKNLKSPKT